MNPEAYSGGGAVWSRRKCRSFPSRIRKNRMYLSWVQALDQKYRAVVHLFYYEGYSTQEIGEILGIRRSCVTTRLNRAREMLKHEMEEETNA